MSSLRSMTGHGRGSASLHGIKVEVDLSTVNRKQLDINVLLPRQLVAFADDPLQACLGDRHFIGPVVYDRQLLDIEDMRWASTRRADARRGIVTIIVKIVR